MKLFKKFGYMALAAAMCLCAVSCGGDDEAEVLLNNVDMTISVTPQGDFNEVFDLKANVSGDTNKAQNVFSNWYGEKFVIDLEYLSCPATIALNVERVPKSSLNIDESKEYNLSYNIDVTINKYFNNGTSEKTTVPTQLNGGKVKGTKLAAYLDTVRGKVDTPYTIRLNASGDN